MPFPPVPIAQPYYPTGHEQQAFFRHQLESSCHYLHQAYLAAKDYGPAGGPTAGYPEQVFDSRQNMWVGSGAPVKGGMWGAVVGHETEASLRILEAARVLGCWWA